MAERKYTYATIAEVEAATLLDGQAIVCTDPRRGGNFTYDAARVAENDGGHVFNGKVRSGVNTGDYNIEHFGGVPNTDATVAAQAAIAAMPTLTHGSTLPGVSVGGGTLVFPSTGKWHITDSLPIPGGVTFRATSQGTAIYFNPPTPMTMIIGDPTRYTRNTGWHFFRMENLILVSTLLSNYIENTLCDFTNFHGWSFSNCYVEGWYKGITGGGAYYDSIQQTEFFNNYIGLEAHQISVIGSMSPITLTGGVFWSYEADWDNYVAQGGQRPSELVISNNTTIIFLGTALEPRGNVHDEDTFVCVRGIASGSASFSGIYTESGYPLMEVDRALAWRRNIHIDVQKGDAQNHIRFKNFLNLTPEAPPYGNVIKSQVTGGLSGGRLLDLIQNTNLQHGEYGYTLNAASVFDPTVKFMGSEGTLKRVFTSTTTLQTSFTYNIPASKLTPYLGQTLHFGMLLKLTNVSAIRAQAFASGSTAKYASIETVDYGDGWKLYIMTVDISSDANDLNINERSNPTASDGSSQIQCAGMFTWMGGISYIPSYGDEYEYKAVAAPTDGIWEVGEKVYNSVPTAGGSVGWTCVIAGSPGTWKGFGAIEA